MTKDEILEALEVLRGVIKMGKDKLKEGNFLFQSNGLNVYELWPGRWYREHRF